ncbi:MAG TPA: hypothetical protein VFV12_08835, partial [Xanthobacteraceae bacterium]|nr:hypothetical protein [Xanthobacteraceae bacterium]
GSSPNAPYIREMASDLVAFKKQHAQDAINSIRDQRDRWVDQQTTGTPEQQLTSSIRAIPAFSDLERRFFEENPQLKEEMDAAREYLDMPERMRLYEARHGLYHRVAGEAEARNVQSRLYMPPEERQRTLPEEDVPREEQIVVRDNQVKGLGTPGKKPPAGNVERFENVVTDEMERRFGPLKRPERQESRKPYGEEGKGRYAERQGPPPPNAPQPYPSGINWDRTTVGEGNIPVGKGQRVIDVDPKALDRALRMTDPEMYELIPGRMERLKSHVDEGKPVSMADVSVSEDGKRVSFTNGRTRTRLAAEHGDKSMPVVVDAEQAGKLQALVRKYAKPRADEVVRQREPFVNKYRESARVPKDVPEHDWSKPTGVPWYDQWGQPGAPEPPSYTAYDPVMTADLAAEEAAARRAGEDRQASYEFGGEPGKPANVNTSQKEIIENLPPPLSLSERTWRNYASRMTPDEMMHSEAVWGGARRIAEETGMPESEAFAQLLNDMWGRAGANRHITPAQARRFMGQERGIRAVEDAGDRQASYEELPREIPSAAGKVTRGHNMPPDEEPLPQERGRRPATPEEAKLRTPETSAPMRGEPATPEAKAVSDTPRHEPLGSNRNEVALTARELHDPSTPKMKAGSRNKEAVARQLELRGARALRALGVRGKLTGPSKHDEMLARVIATEIKDEMARGVASGKRVAHDWYTTKIEEAIGIASAIHPEIATDPIARMAFSAGLAITSQGEKVGMNVRHAMRVYERYKETGRFPTNIKAEKQLFMNSSFKKLNELIKRLGPDGARDFLSRQFTVRELEAASGYKITGENKDTLVNGSAIFGPKIGQGFYQNLTGNFDPVTMDLWFMRGWGRLTNTLTRGAAELQAPLERMRKAMVAARMRPPKDDKELIAKSRAIAAAFERDFAANRKLYDSGKKKKSELVAAAQRVDVNAGGINEQPGSGGRRTWMRAIVNRARELLANEGINITNADLQAIWWYPEKELYAKLGVRGKLEDLNVDYASALRDHARKMGVSDGEIDEALRKLRASSGRPGPGRGADERRGDRTAR